MNLGFIRNGKVPLILLIVITAGALGGSYVVFSYDVIPPNNIGIRYSGYWGVVDVSHPYLPGRHFIGLTYDFYLYPTNPQEFSFIKGVGENTAEECTACIRARTIDGYKVVIEARVQYSIQTENLSELFRTYGTFERFQDLLFSVIRTTINDGVSSNSRIFIINQRQTLSIQIEEILKRRLPVYFVTLLDFNLGSIDFLDNYEQVRLKIL